jgi:hypothetical protein
MNCKSFVIDDFVALSGNPKVKILDKCTTNLSRLCRLWINLIQAVSKLKCNLGKLGTERAAKYFPQVCALKRLQVFPLTRKET